MEQYTHHRTEQETMIGSATETAAALAELNSAKPEAGSYAQSPEEANQVSGQLMSRLAGITTQREHFNDGFTTPGNNPPLAAGMSDADTMASAARKTAGGIAGVERIMVAGSAKAAAETGTGWV
jgi:hypothetical protein